MTLGSCGDAIPVAIGLNEYFLVIFQEQGLGKNVSSVMDTKTGAYCSSGSCGIGLFVRTPHPNALQAAP